VNPVFCLSPFLENAAAFTRNSHRVGVAKTEEQLGKISGEGNVDSGFEVQLEEDGDGSTRQSGAEWRRVVCDTLGVTRYLQ